VHLVGFITRILHFFRQETILVKFDIYADFTIKITAILDVTPRNLLKTFRRTFSPLLSEYKILFFIKSFNVGHLTTYFT